MRPDSARSPRDKLRRGRCRRWLGRGVHTGACAVVAWGCGGDGESPSHGEASGGVVSSSGGADAASGGSAATGGDPGSGAASSGGASSGGIPGSGATTSGGSAGGGAAGAGGDGTGGTYVPMECDPVDSALSVERLDAPTVASMGTPFPTDERDLEGPGSWSTQYGKSPEIIPLGSGNGLDILFQAQDSDAFAYVVHVAPSQGTYVIDAGYRVQSLGRIMGLTKDESGNYYVASGVDEDEQVDETYPPNDIHRSDVVRIVKFDVHGCVAMESDVDVERGRADPDSEIIVNPMVAATSRLVWGADRLLLVHGHNTEPDPALMGTRHQKAISTHIDALDGTVTRTETMWVSHSFDQRALYDGEGFVEMHLGDAYPRTVTLGRYGEGHAAGGYNAFFIKGAEGANNTYTRLGSIVQSGDPEYGYLALFASERTSAAGSMAISGSRDLALVRIESDFASKNPDASIVEQAAGTSDQMVNSSGQSKTNHVRWLTELAEGTHVERPRMTALGDGTFVVLFEQWTSELNGNRYNDTFQGVFALRIDASGEILDGPSEIAGGHHISRGDDIATLGGRAVYVTGGAGALQLNLVDSDLSSERIVLP